MDPKRERLGLSNQRVCIVFSFHYYSEKVSNWMPPRKGQLGHASYCWCFINPAWKRVEGKVDYLPLFARFYACQVVNQIIFINSIRHWTQKDSSQTVPSLACGRVYIVVKREFRITNGHHSVNQFQEYQSNWIISTSRAENWKKCTTPPKTHVGFASGA